VGATRVLKGTRYCDGTKGSESVRNATLNFRTEPLLFATTLTQSVLAMARRAARRRFGGSLCPRVAALITFEGFRRSRHPANQRAGEPVARRTLAPGWRIGHDSCSSPKRIGTETSTSSRSASTRRASTVAASLATSGVGPYPTTPGSSVTHATQRPLACCSIVPESRMRTRDI
jgi:hypothetical protein